MPEVAEMMEQMEHAEHGGSLGRSIGITMAVLGVLLALCSALVGGSRTDLIARMVDQTGATMKYEAATAKYRIVSANLVELHALEPDPAAYQQAVQQGQAVARTLPPASTAQRLGQLTELNVARVLNTVVPTHEDMVSLVEHLEKLDEIKEAAHEWAESYEEALAAYKHASEMFERAQLCAEVGIVICSVALLLKNRPMWYVTLALGVISLILIITTMQHVNHELADARVKISQCQQHYSELASHDKTDDQVLFKEIKAGH
ncbi:MAG: DUF4337 family protein [Candidatus Xenobia bacterium]